MQLSSDKSIMLQHFHIDAATFKLCGLEFKLASMKKWKTCQYRSAGHIEEFFSGHYSNTITEIVGILIGMANNS